MAARPVPDRGGSRQRAGERAAAKRGVGRPGRRHLGRQRAGRPCSRSIIAYVTTQWSGQDLPPAARARMAEIKASGTWGSALSTDEFAAIKSVGFEPVGQVLGAAVYNIGYRGGYGCPSYVGFGNYNRMSYGGYRPSYTAVSSSGSGSAYGPLVATLYSARRKAISRMMAECQELGGHGVVGVLLSIGRFPSGG